MCDLGQIHQLGLSVAGSRTNSGKLNQKGIDWNDVGDLTASNGRLENEA